MRVAFVAWPDDLLPAGAKWDRICADIANAKPDILVTNELPFGPWLAAQPVFDAARAEAAVALHQAGFAELINLGVPAIISSRPVWSNEKLANEAVVIAKGEITQWRRKRFLPAEPGWHEDKWFEAGADSFEPINAHGLSAGVLLCTEAMFNEKARRYGKEGASLIAIPRATGSAAMWRVAGQMAAIISGSYVVSSNRSGGEMDFGGDGFAYAPDGTFIAATLSGQTCAVIDVDPDIAAHQKTSYPCYVPELLAPIS
jgi:N-carbamoylputrescine amidase